MICSALLRRGGSAPCGEAEQGHEDRQASSQQSKVVFELVATTPSAPVQIDIPEGAPVHDWRLLGRAVWRGVRDESRKIETQWSAELLRDIWRQIQRESGSASQREEQK